MPNIIEFDFEKRRVLKAQDQLGNWWRLEGECKICGQCCYKLGKSCEYLREKKCTIPSFHKPYRCVMHPFDPEKPLFKDCGYKWVKVKNELAVAKS